jgi:uncharacterized protein YwqG
MTVPSDIAQELRHDAVGTAVQPYINRVIELTRPAIACDLGPYADVSGFASHLGGVPDVPDGWQWPRSVDGYLRFLAQVNLQDLARFHGAELLPRSGLLSFFYGPELFDAANASDFDVARVYHFASDSLKTATVPEGAVSPATPYSLTFQQIWALPEDKWNLATKNLYADIPDHEHEDFARDLIEIGDAAGAMLLLGYPSREQERFLEYECEAYRQGYEYDSMDGSVDQIAGAAAQWQLLAQFSLSWEQVWPDGNDGYLHYWIRKSDLANKDFSQICYTWERT